MSDALTRSVTRSATRSATAEDQSLEIQREERAIYLIILGALAPVIAGALYEGGAVFGGGTTLSFLIAALGLAGLRTAVHAMRTRVPRARASYRGHGTPGQSGA